MTHHLNRLELAGLVVRMRDPQNRRVHLVDLTPAGQAWFHEMLATVVAFDARLRTGLSDDEVARPTSCSTGCRPTLPTVATNQ